MHHNPNMQYAMEYFNLILPNSYQGSRVFADIVMQKNWISVSSPQFIEKNALKIVDIVSWTYENIKNPWSWDGDFFRFSLESDAILFKLLS